MASIADLNAAVQTIADDVSKLQTAVPAGSVVVAQSDLDSLSANLANVINALAALLPPAPEAAAEGTLA